MRPDVLCAKERGPPDRGWGGGPEEGEEPMDFLGHSNAVEACRKYLERHWAVVPLDGKRPLLRDWPEVRLTIEELPHHFRDGANVGVLLGEPSGGLVDVDLDHPVALRLADHFLPRTGAVFGRPTKPRSHRLYRVLGPLPATRRWSTPDGGVLLELRSTGAQVMVPPSLHPSGERVAWEMFGEPAEVTAEELVGACSRLATAALLALHWPSRGSRHEGSLALAGWLLRRGWGEEEVAEFVRAVAEAAGDEEARDRARNAATTARRLLEGRTATGWPRLRDLLGEQVVRRLEEWVGGTEPAEGLRSLRSLRSQSRTPPIRDPRLPELPQGALVGWAG